MIYGVVAHTLKEALRFMASEGVFMQHLGFWDANGDLRISREEFEADPRGIGKRIPPEVTFSSFDTDGDGFHTAEERARLSQPLVDAVVAEDLETIAKWLTATAAVPVPRTFPEWTREHFDHRPLGDLLLKLNMPVAVFQGDIDTSTPAADVRVLQQRIEATGKQNITFQYFPTLGHDLGAGEYFSTGKLCAGYVAIYEFLQRQTTR